MERTKTRTIDFGELGEKDVEITVNYTPGVAESGRFGRPEDYDPGCDSEADIVSVTLGGNALAGLEHAIRDAGATWNSYSRQHGHF